MPVIGGLQLSNYPLPHRLPSNFASQPGEDTAPPLTRGAGPVSGEAASLKLSAALFELSVSNDGERSGSMHGGAAPEASLAEQEFLSLANMDLAQLIRAIYLEDKNLTEEGLAALPEIERKAIEDEIREAILRSIGVEDIGETRGEQAPGPDTGAPSDAGQPLDVTSIVT